MAATKLSVSPTSTGTAIGSSPESETFVKRKGKKGRPNQWSTPRRRQLARLYAFTTLPREDIPRALEDSADDWLPGKESTTKTVNAILGHEPRWLRPKDRTDMDKKIQELDQGKKDRKKRRRWKNTPASTPPRNDTPTTEISDSQLDALLADLPTIPSTLSEEHRAVYSRLSGLLHARDSLVVPIDSVHIRDWDDSPLGEFEDGCRWSVSDTGSHASTISIRSLQERLSKYSITYIKAVARVLKTHSITDSSVVTCSARSSVTSSYVNEADETVTIRAASTSRAKTRQRSILLLPNSIMLLDSHINNQGLCLEGMKSHDAESCWCRVEQHIRGQTWVSRDGLINRKLSDPALWHDGPNLTYRDAFGNTVLHLLAARGCELNTLLYAIQSGVDCNATNSAGQTFLHTLTGVMMVDLATDYWKLTTLVQALRLEEVDMTKCDAFGRSFWHLLTRTASSCEKNALRALSNLGVEFSTNKDAFGWSSAFYATWWFFEFVEDPQAQDPERWSSALSFCDEQIPVSTSSSTPEHDSGSDDSMNEEEEDAGSPRYHAHLLSIATKSMVAPSTTDSQDRNGLHCLAEADLSIDSVSAEPSRKRKRGQGNGRLSLRYESAVSLVACGVDVNSYDGRGTTVLMAFVKFMKDEEDDEMLAKLLRMLIEKGASIDRRNRVGETALHIAVRLGRTKATQVLLESGANIHARNSKGQGVLTIGHNQSKKAGEDGKLYGCIMACIALCIRHGAVASPTLVDEWTEPDRIGVALG